VFEELWPHMNTGSHRIYWIFLHMEVVLSKCAKSRKLGEHVRAVVTLIRKLLSDFAQGKTGGGDSWEALFVVALLIRIVCREEDGLLYYLPAAVLAKCTMSYNDHWVNTVGGEEVLFENVESLNDFGARLVKPGSFPHVVVYYPCHARFQYYDVIMAVYDEHGTVRLTGYQLKEGREIPEDPGQFCDMSVLIRGAPAQKGKKLRNWIIASEAQIGSFLGETGKVLVPKEWRKMETGEGVQPAKKKAKTGKKKPAKK
jgi:hypothetical protein